MTLPFDATTGFEPVTTEPKSVMLPITLSSIVEQIKGIEPSSSAWQADALTVVLYLQVLSSC